MSTTPVLCLLQDGNSCELATPPPTVQGEPEELSTLPFAAIGLAASLDHDGLFKHASVSTTTAQAAASADFWMMDSGLNNISFDSLTSGSSSQPSLSSSPPPRQQQQQQR